MFTASATEQGQVATFKKIDVGIVNQTLAEVTAGLSEGDHIVTTGAAALREGDRILMPGQTAGEGRQGGSRGGNRQGGQGRRGGEGGSQNPAAGAPRS